MAINRLLTNICCENLVESKEFYTQLLGLNVGFESDWFMHLVADNSALELGLILPTHEVVPGDVKGQTIAGAYLTFVVEDVETVHATAQRSGATILEAPAPTDYGQMRMLLKAPEGTVVDVSSLIK